MPRSLFDKCWDDLYVNNNINPGDFFTYNTIEYEKIKVKRPHRKPPRKDMQHYRNINSFYLNKGCRYPTVIQIYRNRRK